MTLISFRRRAPLGKRRERMLRGVGVWGTWTLVSRMAGFLRELLMANAFGTTSAASALVVAQTVPNLARTLVSEEAARGALLPVLAEQRVQGEEERSETLTWAVAAWATVVMSAISLIVWITASWSTKLLAPGGGERANVAGQAAPLLRLLIPIILSSGIGAAASAVLVARGRIAAASVPLALSNVPLLLGLIFAHPTIRVAAILIAAGVALQVGLQVLFAWQGRVASVRPRMLRWSSDLRIVLSLAIPVALALGASAFSGLVDTAFSTMVGSGGPAALDKAIRLILVPYGMFAVAISVVTMPTLVEARLSPGHSFDSELARAVRLQASLLLPVALVVGVFAHPIIHAVYERGAFNVASTMLTSRALLGMSFVLPAFGLSLIGSRAWLSKKRPWLPAAAMVAGVIINGLLDWALVGPFGLLGIGIATAVVHTSIGTTLLVTAADSASAFLASLSSFAIRLAIVGTGAWVVAEVSARFAISAAVGDGVRAAAMLGVFALGARLLNVDDYLDFATAVGRRGRTRTRSWGRISVRSLWWGLMALAATATGWLAVVAPARVMAAGDAVLLDHRLGLVVGLLMGAAMIVLVIRSLGRDATPGLIARVLAYGYFSLLFFGLSALDALRILKEAAWPIAATQPLPTDQDVRRAFLIGFGAGVLLITGLIISMKLRPRRSSPRDATTGEWLRLQILAPVFAVAGLAGVAVVFLKTREVALFSSNIDQLRFSQGSGLGYASLLQYELLVAGCLSGATFVAHRASRAFSAVVFLASVGTLVLFRAERTPVLVAVASTFFVYAFRGGRYRRRLALISIPILIAVTLALGLARLESSIGPLGSERAVVRAVFDVSPEFREASYVYRVYPTDAPFIGRRAVAADLSSVIPSRVLRVVGVNKRGIYSDISHEYSATMRSLGIYPLVKPLRVGLVAELWADFGGVGVVLGMLLYGVLAGLVATSSGEGAVGTVRQAVATALLLVALVTPLGSLLPLVLMVIGPLILLQRRPRTSFDTRTAVAEVLA